MPSLAADTKAIHNQGLKISDEGVVNGSKIVDDEGRLAGAHLDMASAVRNAVRMLGVDLVGALRMASTHPAAFLKLGDDVGRISPGQRANLALLDDQLQVRSTWIDGRAG